MKNLVLIDNYDSFTFNIYQYLGELGNVPQVFRNDAITIQELGRFDPSLIVISPGPCTPKKAGISIDVVRHFGEKVPILGVCLGHQAIVEAYGGIVSRANRIMHGKPSMIFHDGLSLFKDIPSPFRAIRYHSLIAKSEDVPNALSVVAVSEYNEVMAVRHEKFRVFGVQFHPESILTDHGYTMLKNFLDLGLHNET